MKRIIIAIAVIFFCFSGAHAQLLKGYGFKTGVVVAEQDFDYSHGFEFATKSRAGFDFGIFTEWLNLPFFSVLTEAHYVQKGMTHESPRLNEFGEPIGSVKEDSRLVYLSVPILAKITFDMKHLSPYLVIGPRFDFLLDYSSRTLKIIYDDLEDSNKGGTLGIGIDSKIQSVKVLFELRYSPDFSNAYHTDLLKVKNSSFEILFGLRL